MAPGRNLEDREQDESDDSLVVELVGLEKPKVVLPSARAVFRIPKRKYEKPSQSSIQAAPLPFRVAQGVLRLPGRLGDLQMARQGLGLLLVLLDGLFKGLLEQFREVRLVLF